MIFLIKKTIHKIYIHLTVQSRTVRPVILAGKQAQLHHASVAVIVCTCMWSLHGRQMPTPAAGTGNRCWLAPSPRLQSARN